MESTLANKFNDYPQNVQPILKQLRSLIFKVAEESQLDLEETLKWGEPSYSAKQGSPIRMDWKAKTPNEYYLFFHCQTKLIDTFKELYGDSLQFQGNRAIVLNLSNNMPEPILKHCIALALNYHKVKHLPLLGA